MATIKVCDLHFADGQLVEAQYRTGFPHSAKADLCSAHRNHFKGMSREAFVHEMLRLSASGLV